MSVLDGTHGAGIQAKDINLKSKLEAEVVFSETLDGCYSENIFKFYFFIYGAELEISLNFFQKMSKLTRNPRKL